MVAESAGVMVPITLKEEPPRTSVEPFVVGAAVDRENSTGPPAVSRNCMTPLYPVRFHGVPGVVGVGPASQTFKLIVCVSPDWMVRASVPGIT
jgi:hypothetical protein